MEKESQNPLVESLPEFKPEMQKKSELSNEEFERGLENISNIEWVPE